MAAALRLVTKEKTGTIQGSVTDALNQTGSKVVVNGNDQYTLAFLEAGDYSLYFVAYEDANSDGKLEEKGTLLLDVLAGLNLSNVMVGASATVRLDVVVTGIAPF